MKVKINIKKKTTEKKNEMKSRYLLVTTASASTIGWSSSTWHVYSPSS